jgi:hypothetical protein
LFPKADLTGADEVVLLLRDHERGRGIGANGRKTVRWRYDWSIIEGLIEAILPRPDP